MRIQQMGEFKHEVPHRFIASENPNEPHSPRDFHLVRMQEVQKVVTFCTMRDILPEFIEWYLGIRKVRKPCLSLSLVQGRSCR